MDLAPLIARWIGPVALLGVLGANAAALAEPAPGSAASPPVPEQGIAGESLLRVMDRVDRYFGDDNFEGTTNESFVRLAPGVRIREGPKFSFKPRFRASLKLPRISRRLGLILFGRNDERNPIDTDDDVGDGFAAGLRAALFDDEWTKLRLSAGSRFKPEPDPFVRLRLQRLIPAAGLVILPSVRAFWELEDGLGERTRLDIATRVGPRAVVRLRGEASYGQSTEGVEFRTSVSHFFTLRERSAWQIQLRFDAHTRPRTEVSGYRGFVRYRWSMWRRWLFFDLEPGIRFERKDGFKAAPELTAHVEVVFGSLRRLGEFGAAGREPSAGERRKLQ